MVREGKMAEVLACRKAKVKRPVPGKALSPERAVVTEAGFRRPEGPAEIPGLPVRQAEDGARQAAPAVVEAAEWSAVCASPKAREISEAPVSPVAWDDRGREEHPQPPVWRAVGQSLPVSEKSKLVRVQERKPGRADRNITLAQLFDGRGGQKK